MGLRRPENFKGERLAVLNIGSKIHGVWPIVRDISPKPSVELIRNSSYINSVDMQNSNLNISNNYSYMTNNIETSHISLRGLEEASKLHVSNQYKFFLD